MSFEWEFIYSNDSYGIIFDFMETITFIFCFICRSLNDNKETQDLDSREEKFEKEIPVYNFICSVENPMTWGEFPIYVCICS